MKQHNFLGVGIAFILIGVCYLVLTTFKSLVMGMPFDFRHPLLFIPFISGLMYVGLHLSLNTAKKI